MSAPVTPFRIDVPQETLDDLHVPRFPGALSCRR